MSVGVLGVELRGRHGVTERERRVGRRFAIDVLVEGDWSAAAASDDLDDAYDVEDMVETIRAVNERTVYHLVESFAAAIADEILLRNGRATAARVTVRKMEFRAWGRKACTRIDVTRRRG
ncbi:MAG: dihydroneopterin aldolase [Candidatus Bipolaricaulota bacterium]